MEIRPRTKGRLDEAALIPVVLVAVEKHEVNQSPPLHSAVGLQTEIESSRESRPDHGEVKAR